MAATLPRDPAGPRPRHAGGRRGDRAARRCATASRRPSSSAAGPSAACAIPADAVAVTGNLTVTGQTGRGYLSLTPTPQASPTTSTLNFPVGDTRANNVTVPLGAGGRVWVVLSRHRHGARHPRRDRLLHRAAPAAPAGCRSPRPASSTAASASGYGGAFRDDTPGSVTVLGRGGIGADADALTGNLTVTGQTRRGLHVAHPGARTRRPRPRPSTSRPARRAPTASPRGSTPRRARSASSTRPRSGATTHLLLDVTGYYH